MFAVASLLGGCAALGNLFNIGNGPVLVEQAAAANDCRSKLAHDSVTVLPTPAAVGQLQLQRGFRLTFPGPLPDGPYVLVDVVPSADHARGLVVSRQAQIYKNVLYLTATYLPELGTPPVGTPCVLVAIPPGRYQQVEVSDPSGKRRALGSVSPAAESVEVTHRHQAAD
ncbi:MAG TPA: hypothetical protein VFQ88_04200 [Nevskiaceae bacterium]|nr:hypothetical protein [Nevskiaceae bacterium]